MTWNVVVCVVLLLQTDTASVLLEAIGYIRFLQGQIEVMFLSHDIEFSLQAIQSMQLKFSPKHSLVMEVIKILFSFPPPCVQALSSPYMANASKNIRSHQSVSTHTTHFPKQRHISLSHTHKHKHTRLRPSSRIIYPSFVHNVCQHGVHKLNCFS